MAIQNAVNFISDVHFYPELRKSVNSSTKNTLFETLEKEGYAFTPDEFEEAVNMVHVKCKEEEQAMALMQVAHWFRLLLV